MNTPPSDNLPLSNRDRLEIVLRHSGEPTYNALARRLGLKRGENLYQVLKGNYGISRRLADRIHTVFPAFSIGWLTIADSGTTSCSPFQSIMDLPLYMDWRFLEKGSRSEPDQMVLFPKYFCPEAEIATLCQTDALEPRVMLGAYMLLRRTTIDRVLFGNIYLVSTPTIALLRIVRSGETDDRLRLLSMKPEKYGEITIPREEVISLFRVCGTFLHMSD